ncbi:hypothetical protein GH714_033889 [Hevea brasiliensis]|uniref:Carboxypeptidase n=1 Tax=Hevea brasiliensis TaxID=3981 RepID=A0A6A6N8D2_HEVBR|nr:hypothetical protein GH714_033889 [Hevea brasiliensis]
MEQGSQEEEITDANKQIVDTLFGINLSSVGGSKENDRIQSLPGQPKVAFEQYGGYITVDKSAGRAYYYYFVEAKHSKESLPLLLWLNGGLVAHLWLMEQWKSLDHLEYIVMAKHFITTIFHGMTIGNAVINDETDNLGMYDYYGNHALTSPETVQKIHQYCNFSPDFVSKQSRECNLASGKADHDTADIDIYNIYWPLCHNGNLTAKPKQARDILGSWKDSPSTVIPLLQEFMANGLRVWIYSGDTDGRVGGYSQVYQGDLTFVTVRGAGHQVPSYQPERSLSMIKHFLSGNPLPKGSSSQRPFATVGFNSAQNSEITVV